MSQAWWRTFNSKQVCLAAVLVALACPAPARGASPVVTNSLFPVNAGCLVGAGTLSITQPFTTYGSNRMVFASVMQLHQAAATVQYNGTNLLTVAAIDGLVGNWASWTGRYLFNPTLGTNNFTVSVTYGADGLNHCMAAAFWAWAGTNSGTAPNGNFTTCGGSTTCTFAFGSGGSGPNNAAISFAGTWNTGGVGVVAPTCPATVWVCQYELFLFPLLAAAGAGTSSAALQIPDTAANVTWTTSAVQSEFNVATIIFAGGAGFPSGLPTGFLPLIGVGQ